MDLHRIQWDLAHLMGGKDPALWESRAIARQALLAYSFGLSAFPESAVTEEAQLVAHLLGLPYAVGGKDPIVIMMQDATDFLAEYKVKLERNAVELARLCASSS